MNTLCGRFASYVQIIHGTPINAISFLLSFHVDSFISTHLVMLLSYLMLMLSILFLILFGSIRFFFSSSISSTNQKQAWIRLMINALETNFFYYQSDPSIFFIILYSFQNQRIIVSRNQQLLKKLLIGKVQLLLLLYNALCMVQSTRQLVVV